MRLSRSMINSEIRNASLKDKSYTCPQTICFAIVLLLVVLLEFRNLYLYISSFIEGHNNKVAIILNDLKISLSTSDAIKSMSISKIIQYELEVNRQHALYNMVISVLSSVLTLYFALSALWLCWKCQVKSFASVFKKLMWCIMVWFMLSMFVIFIDFFSEIDPLVKALMIILFLFIMSMLIQEDYNDIFKNDIIMDR